MVCTPNVFNNHFFAANIRSSAQGRIHHGALPPWRAHQAVVGDLIRREAVRKHVMQQL